MGSDWKGVRRALAMSGHGSRAVVTGGCGFIGSHLAGRLLELGMEVVVIDDLSTGRLENLAHVGGHPSLRVVKADIADLERVRREFDGATHVFHLAGLADIVPSIEHPERYHRANVDGTVAALVASAGAGVRRFVYAASSSCYGIPDRYPTSETDAVRPAYPYALTKHVGEQYVIHWSRVYGLPAVSLRLFNVYGPRSRTSGTYGAVFGVFLRQKLANRPFTVVGDGSQTRDFVYVTDVVEAFVKAALSGLTGEILNVGAGRPVSISRLTELLGGDVEFIPRRPGEPDCTHADISKITRLLGWSPGTPFERGVEHMMREIERWKDAPLWDADSIRAATEGWFRHMTEERVDESR